MRPLFNRQSLWVYPIFASIGGGIGYWLTGVEQRNMAILNEKREKLLQKRIRRAQAEGRTWTGSGMDRSGAVERLSAASGDGGAVLAGGGGSGGGGGSAVSKVLFGEDKTEQDGRDRDLSEKLNALARGAAEDVGTGVDAAKRAVTGEESGVDNRGVREEDAVPRRTGVELREGETEPTGPTEPSQKRE
ncbi:MAG: hypothetical protein M1831_007571 [Alyxoria varia]|nr:MAG: hypothetical protein M1831_007571 [Alyxoria varia]